MKWETVIGLEIHAQLLTKTKLFCSCPATFGKDPNTETCPICLGMPGTLPVLNQRAVELALRAASALNCRINHNSVFARKNYFYPDLPKGYQISQYDKPLAEKGYVEVETENKRKRIGITRVHLEEDAGKLIHEPNEKFSIIDYNRSCVPLIEIVSEPDIRSSREASEYLKMLRLILIYNGICDGNMELGNLRCDANISVRKEGAASFGVKTEMKNMNSFNFIGKALDYEAKRQVEILEKEGRVIQETLLWDTKTQKTYTMRTKEEAHDYRYFEEPDLLPLKVDEKYLQKILKETALITSETITERLNELQKNFSVSRPQAETIVNSPESYQIFEKSIKKYSKNPSRSSTLITVVLPTVDIAKMDRDKIAIAVADTVKAEDEGRISIKMGKEIFEEALKTGKEITQLIGLRGEQISESCEIDPMIEKVISNNKGQVEAYRKGKEQLFNFLLGQLMKESKGKINPNIAKERLKEKLKG